jgi:two-component system, sensor histidine kinase and response regulator
MDGFEATATIRAKEKVSGEHVPIVAMTAHAMKGDRERCLEAGMDRYVSKPLEPEELFRVVENLAVGSSVAPQVAPPSSTVFDYPTVLKRMRGNAVLVKELIGLFLGECTQSIEELRLAIERRDAPKLKAVGHALKGSAGNFGVQAVCDAAERLETMGQAGDLDGADRGLAALEAAVNEVRPVLAEFARDPSTADR